MSGASFRYVAPTRDESMLIIRELPEGQTGQYALGELLVSPRPAMRHALAASVLGNELTGPFQRSKDGPGGWWILDEPELHLGDAIVVPDLAGWRRERLPEIPDVAALELAPDWVCEVLSPSTAAFDRTRKLPVYATAGVQHVWLVDPAARTLEVLRRYGERWILASTHARDEEVRAEPFDAAALELGALWAGPG